MRSKARSSRRREGSAAVASRAGVQVVLLGLTVGDLDLDVRGARAFLGEIGRHLRVVKEGSEMVVRWGARVRPGELEH